MHTSTNIRLDTRPAEAGTAKASPLLICGAIAGPLYVAVSLTQALLRPGFDLTRHPWSLLANGPAGWVQMTNLIVTGLLVVLAAVGFSRAVSIGTGHRAIPILLGIFGAGMIGAGIFRADPMAGFPLGTPDGPPVEPTLSGLLHLTLAGIGFLGLIVACFVFGRRFARAGRRGWAVYSVLTGVVFFAAFAGIASGSSAAPIVLGFVGAVVLAWCWLLSISLAHYRHQI